MAFRKLKLRPGVDLEQSATLNETQLAASNLIRFYGGLPQKLGGWQALSSDTFIGTCTGLHGWADIMGNPYLGVGTEQRLDALIGGSLFDITPLVATTNPAVAFTTTSGSAVVTILDAGHSPSTGDWVNILTHVSVGGLVLFGSYQATNVDATHYTITATSNATSSVAAGGAVTQYSTLNTSPLITVLLNDHGLSVGSLFNAAVATTVATVAISGIYSVTTVTNANVFVITAGSLANATTSASENSGNARIRYLIPTGYAIDTALTGYGIGDYGSGDYGLAGSGQVTAPPRQWSLDHWGQYLIASPSGGAIYYWNPPTVTPAVVVSGSAPIYNAAVFVMPQIQILVALGAEISGTQQPLLVRWCDAGDFTAWTASATNQAGSYSIPTGTKLVTGLAVGLGALLWTDVDLWSMSYQGLPFVFGFNRIATQCGIISQRSAVVAGNDVMWLSTRGFFSYTQGGGITPLECPVADFVIFNIDQTQLDQTFACHNSVFNEVSWFFPISTTSSVYSASAPLGYVKFNYVEKVWDYGLSSQYQRTAWVGRSPVGNPVGADTAGLLQQHDVGFDANGAAMLWSWQTGYFDLDEGESYVFVDLLIPDFVTLNGAVIMITLFVTTYPNTPPTSYGPYTVSTTTPFVPVRLRGRQVAIRVSGSDLGTFNRLGAIRYRFARDGRE